MYKILLSSILFLFYSISALATDFVVPTQKIIGADTTYEAGEMIVLRISPIDPKPEYLVDIKYQWLVLNPDGSVKNNILIYPDNTTIFFSPGVPRQTIKLTALLTATYLYVVKDSNEVVKEIAVRSSPIIFGRITVNGLNPSPPGPDPGPNPQPDPIFPPGKYELARHSYNFSKSVLLPPAERSKSANALAGSYSSIAAAIAAGTVRDLKEALEKVTQSNRAALTNVGVSAAAWEPFFISLQNFTYELHVKGQLATVQDAAIAFQEIAEGLRQVK
jgi:hypothetical protein